jgi:hypothetical protein
VEEVKSRVMIDNPKVKQTIGGNKGPIVNNKPTNGGGSVTTTPKE